MQLRGVIRTAGLQEHPEDSEKIEMVLAIQGVSPGQPRRLVVPHEFLLRETTLEPEEVRGRSFVANVDQDESGRWIVRELSLAAKILRPETGA